MCALSTVIYDAELESIKLPQPKTDGGSSLMSALKNRATSREFDTRKLPLQILSNLLWAAFGINRPDSGMRTAPSTYNWQELDIYVSTAGGLYLYDAGKHVLQPVSAEDIRVMTGVQEFVKDAPVSLVYVADLSKMVDLSETDRDIYSAADSGFISQNVCLYCASEGLATGVRGYIDKPALAEKMGLREEQKIILAQSVGYPKK